MLLAATRRALFLYWDEIKTSGFASPGECRRPTPEKRRATFSTAVCICENQALAPDASVGDVFEIDFAQMPRCAA